MSAIDNERTKLTASWLNAMASGVVVTGAIAPVVAVYFGLTGPGQANVITLVGGELIWLAFGVALHLLGRRILGRLTP